MKKTTPVKVSWSNTLCEEAATDDDDDDDDDDNDDEDEFLCGELTNSE